MQPSDDSRVHAPYAVHRIPTALIETMQLSDGRSVLVRPVLPQDADLQQAFVRQLSPLSRRRRFHGPMVELSPSALRYMTEVDYKTHLAILAAVFVDGVERQVAEARWVRRSDEPDTADFALAVADDWQRSGLGTRLLQRLGRSARESGVQRLYGDVLHSNQPMIDCMRRAGARLRVDPLDASALGVEIDVKNGADAPWRAAA
jgi:GNAT superfamily N-acetyltransferase